MMTKSNLPKLWLYITLATILLSLALVSCTKSSDNSPVDDNTTSDDKYTVTYMPDEYVDAQPFVLTVQAGQKFFVEGPAFARDGYTLVGWTCDKNKEGEYYPLGTELILDSSTTFYPVWQLDTYEIVFSPGANSTGTPIVVYKNHDEAFAFSKYSFTRKGYTQIGWSLIDGGEKAFDLAGEYIENAPLTLYPVWQKNTYTVTVKPGGSASGDTLSAQVTFEDKYTAPSQIYSRVDYDLVGWSTEDGGALKYQLGEEITVSENVTLYPVWELTKTYDVTVDYKKLPKTLMTTMSVADLALYYKLVNAFLSCESSVAFTSDTRPELVIEILDCYFPVMYVNIAEGGPWIDAANNTINFDYITTDIDEHNQRIAQFTKDASVYLSGFNRTDTDVERTLLIYQRLQNTVILDSTAELYPEMFSNLQNSAYSVIMNAMGASKAISSAYAFLLTQADVDAVLVSSDYELSAQDHYFVAIMLDFKWYYADVTLDLEEKQLTHFGMSNKEMVSLGYANAENNAITAYTGKNVTELIDTLDTRFHVFHDGAYSVVLDRDNDMVIFKNANGEQKQFNIIEHIG